MMCSNCGSPRTRYVKTVTSSSKKYSNEFLLQTGKEVAELFRCMTCGGNFHLKKSI